MKPGVLLALALFVSSAQTPREVAITFDDLPVVSVVPRDIAALERITGDLLSSIERHGIPAIGFVNESKLQPAGVVDERRVALLRRWVRAGLELGNHTYSHPDLHTTPLEDYQRDVLKGEVVTRQLLAEAGRKPRFFRHPFLRTGRSLDTRGSFEAFLRDHGYRVAPITIDNYDYIFSAAFDRAADPAAREKISVAYLEYMTDVVSYYERQSIAIVGREIRQTLLLHANALNARALDGLAGMLKGRGYRFIPLDRALEDPAYQSEDTFVGPGGITWLHRWALTQGKRGTFFAGEPAVPGWIARASK